MAARFARQKKAMALAAKAEAERAEKQDKPGQDEQLEWLNKRQKASRRKLAALKALSGSPQGPSGEPPETSFQSQSDSGGSDSNASQESQGNPTRAALGYLEARRRSAATADRQGKNDGAHIKNSTRLPRLGAVRAVSKFRHPAGLDNCCTSCGHVISASECCIRCGTERETNTTGKNHLAPLATDKRLKSGIALVAKASFLGHARQAKSTGPTDKIDGMLAPVREQAEQSVPVPLGSVQMLAEAVAAWQRGNKQQAISYKFDPGHVISAKAHFKMRAGSSSFGGLCALAKARNVQAETFAST